MELKPKQVLQQKGQAGSLSLKSKGGTGIQAKMTWKKAVDLDLHAFYKTKDGKIGHVYFGSPGSLAKMPHIALDKDAGVGNTAGNNEENIRIARLDHLASVIIATNIFRVFGFLSAGDNFAKYDGKVTITSDTGDCIEIPLASEELGRWCVIAKIDNSGGSPQVININRVQKAEPQADEF
jgi:tellurite resistance protein TerA